MQNGPRLRAISIIYSFFSKKIQKLFLICKNFKSHLSRVQLKRKKGWKRFLCDSYEKKNWKKNVEKKNCFWNRKLHQQPIILQYFIWSPVKRCISSCVLVTILNVLLIFLLKLKRVNHRWQLSDVKNILNQSNCIIFS